jgi:hypothetical protein
MKLSADHSVVQDIVPRCLLVVANVLKSCLCQYSLLDIIAGIGYFVMS